MEPQRNGAEGVTVIVFVIVIVEKQCFSPYKITKNLRDYQRITGLFSVFSKILMGIKEILRRECGGDEVRSMGVDAQLQSQSDEAAV